MAGGGVVYQGGRTLDPRLQFLAAQARGARRWSLSPDEARRANDPGLAPSRATRAGVRWRR
jgi:hypothetical protein